MDCQRRWRWFSPVWLLILGVFALRETQTAHHKHMAQFTAVGTTHSLLELTLTSFIDDIELASYNNIHKQIISKIPWTSKVMGVDYTTHIRNLLMYHERHVSWMMHYLAKNDTNPNRNHTGQLLADCEIDNDITVKSQIHLIWDGEEYYRIDEEIGHWELLKPEFKKYLHILESPIWTNLRKLYMNQFCVDLMRKIVGYSNLRDNGSQTSRQGIWSPVPPEVTVSLRVNPEGSIILSCTATGFYPQSILLRWEKNGKLGIWGKENSTGILPNMDNTFYLQITLELPPEDSGLGYTCVVEHIELKTPTVYPVPEKPTVEKPWALALGIVLAVILLLSCARAFIKWKKRKSESPLLSCRSTSGLSQEKLAKLQAQVWKGGKQGHSTQKDGGA